MKKRKVIALLLVLSMLFCVACGGKKEPAPVEEKPAETKVETTAETKETQSAPQQEAATPGEKVQVQFWHSMGGKNGELMETMIKTFNESQDEVEIIGSYQGGYYDSVAKAVAAVATGEGPDLIQMGSGQVVILSQEGVTANLLDYMTPESGVTLDDFVEGFYIDYYEEDNKKLNALPMGCSTPVLYVNMNMLKEAGKEVPKSWEELAQTCRDLKKDGYADFGYSFVNEIWYFWTMVETWGGPCFSEDGLSLACYDNGTAIDSFEFMRQMVEEDILRPSPTTDGSKQIQGWFTGGECPFLMHSIGGLSGIVSAAKENGIEVGVYQVPGHEMNGTINYAIPYGGNTMVMLDGSDKKDAAWKFMQWLYTSDDGIAYFDANTGYLACSDTIKNTNIIKERMASDENYSRAHEYLDYVVTDYLIEAAGDVGNDLKAFMDAVLYDKEDPKAALEAQLDGVAEILKDHEGRQ